MAQVYSEKYVQEDGAQGKDQSYQAFRQHIQRACGGEPPAHPAWRLLLFERQQKKEGAQRQPQADYDVRNLKTRKEVGSERSRKHDSRIESRALAVGVLAKSIDREQERQHPKNQRKASAPVLNAEQFVAGGYAPVHEWGFFQVADSIRIKRYPIMTEHHLARGFGVDRVHVIEKGRNENTSQVNSGPQEKNQAEREAADSRGPAKRQKKRFVSSARLAARN